MAHAAECRSRSTAILCWSNVLRPGDRAAATTNPGFGSWWIPPRAVLSAQPTTHAGTIAAALCENDTVLRRDASSLAAACVSGGALDANSFIYGIRIPKNYYYDGLQALDSEYLEVSNGVSGISWPPPTPSYSSSTKKCTNALIGVSFTLVLTAVP